MPTKYCPRCTRTLDIETFNKDKQKSDGRCSYCRDCSKEVSKGNYNRHREARCKTVMAYRERHRKSIRAYLREYYKDNADKYRQDKLRRKAEDPRVIKAQTAVRGAIRNGTLIRLPCAVCNHVPAQAHHESYEPDRWLDVTWLCRRHHRLRHLELKSQTPTQT